MENDSSSFYNRILSSAPQINQKRQFRKNSQQSMQRQRRQSINEFKQQTQLDITQRGIPSLDKNVAMTKKKAFSVTNELPTTQPAMTQLASIKQQQTRVERMEEDQRREYLAQKVTPVLNKMLVKIVNQKPPNILNFMINFLKNEEDKFEKKRFNDKAQNDTISQDKHMQEIFDQTVATKFLKFKK